MSSRHRVEQTCLLHVLLQVYNQQKSSLLILVQFPLDVVVLKFEFIVVDMLLAFFLHHLCILSQATATSSARHSWETTSKLLMG